MNLADSITAVADEVAVAIRQYAEIATSPGGRAQDIDQAWILVREALDAFVDLAPTPISVSLPKVAPQSSRRHPVVWIDVGYAVEVRDQRRAASIARSRVSAGDGRPCDDEWEEVFDVDAVALVDFLESADGWDPSRYQGEALRVVTSTRAVRALTHSQVEKLRQSVESGSDVPHRPDF